MLFRSNNYGAEPLYILSGGQTDFGTLAVNGFFAISGFLITRSCLLTDNAARYFKKRLARIVPGFMLASLLGIFVFGPLGADDAAAFLGQINVRGTLVRVLSLHQSSLSETFQHNPMRGMLDGTLWTIKYEFDCYVCVAILWVFGLLRRGPVTALLIALTAGLALQRIGVFTPPAIDHGVPAILVSSPANWPRLFSFFFAGAAF